MEFSSVIKNRMSIRDFDSKDVSKEVLAEIVAEAGLAPSWANSQPWKVYVVTGQAMSDLRMSHLEKSEAKEKGRPDLPTKSIQDWGDQPWANMKAWLATLEDNPKTEEFYSQGARLFNAPAMAYITISKDAPIWSIHDTGMFSQSLMLSAQNKGVDSMIAYENVKWADEIRQFAGVPEDELIVSGIALGYRSQHIINDFKSNRMPVEDILTIKE